MARLHSYSTQLQAEMDKASLMSTVSTVQAGHTANDSSNRTGGNRCGNKSSWKKDDKSTKKPQFNGQCHYCKKTGHLKRDCFKYKRDLKEDKVEKKN